MTFKSIGVLAIGAAAALSFASVAAAQTAAPKPAAAAAPMPNPGPVIPGVCIFSKEGAIGTSTVGKYLQGRLQQIGTQVNAELNAERTAIENDAKALDAQKATLSQDQLEQRNAALQVRANAFQRKAQLRDREMQATEQKAVQRVLQEVGPILQGVYGQRGCGLLIDGNSVMGANPQMDVTPAVVTQLNAKLTQFPFDREHLDQQPAGAAPAN